MTKNSNRLDLIQRLAEKQSSDEKLSLAERAAEKLNQTPAPSQHKTATATPLKPDTITATPAAAENTESPQKSVDSPSTPHSPQQRNVVGLDFGQLERAGYITPNEPQSHIAEEFRTIKRPLLLSAFGTEKNKVERGNVILVTSAKPGEGKTFISLNLALSIASERDLHVLIIDTDVYRRRLEEELGLDDKKGLVDLLLEDDLNLPDLLVRTDVPNLTVLPVGVRNPQAPELLSSQKMATLMTDIAARYPDRVIIIDSPPILASSEASVLAMLVGQIVFVVEAHKTDAGEIEQSLKLINTCENINFVINKAGVDSNSSPYGTYSYYDEYRQSS